MPQSLFVDLDSIDLARTIMDRAKIDAIIPHRGEMALVDGVCYSDLKKEIIVGWKDVRADEFWTNGHFPGNPLMPGVVLVEASAQLALILFKLVTPEIADRLVVFGGIDKVRFRSAVRTGDRIYIVARNIECSSRGARCGTQGIVNGKVVYEGEVFAVVT